jgi:hypothetical protein
MTVILFFDLILRQIFTGTGAKFHSNLRHHCLGDGLNKKNVADLSENAAGQQLGFETFSPPPKSSNAAIRRQAPGRIIRFLDPRRIPNRRQILKRFNSFETRNRAGRNAFNLRPIVR